MAHRDYPITTAVRFLRERGVEFTPHLYQYEEHGGTRTSARELGLPEHMVIKTLVMETDKREPLLVLMHGDREVSTKKLARNLGVKTVLPAGERAATHATGYQFGGTSPFGTRTRLTVCVEKSILDLPRIVINGGKRGFLVEIESRVLRDILPITEVEVAVTTD